MSNTGINFNEGRRCAELISAQAAEIGSLIEGESCELCHMLSTYAQKLRVLASDLSAVTEACEEHDRKHN